MPGRKRTLADRGRKPGHFSLLYSSEASKSLFKQVFTGNNNGRSPMAGKNPRAFSTGIAESSLTPYGIPHNERDSEAYRTNPQDDNDDGKPHETLRYMAQYSIQSELWNYYESECDL